MTWPPVSSADVAELREIEAEAAAAERADADAHRTRCEDGWLGETDDGAVIPCLLCRPHLRPKDPA